MRFMLDQLDDTQRTGLLKYTRKRELKSLNVADGRVRGKFFGMRYKDVDEFMECFRVIYYGSDDIPSIFNWEHPIDIPCWGPIIKGGVRTPKTKGKGLGDYLNRSFSFRKIMTTYQDVEEVTGLKYIPTLGGNIENPSQGSTNAQLLWNKDQNLHDLFLTMCQQQNGGCYELGHTRSIWILHRWMTLYFHNKTPPIKGIRNLMKSIYGPKNWFLACEENARLFVEHYADTVLAPKGKHDLVSLPDLLEQQLQFSPHCTNHPSEKEPKKYPPRKDRSHSSTLVTVFVSILAFRPKETYFYREIYSH